MLRDKILDTAKELINGPRSKTYGDPWLLHSRVADMWSVILGISVTPKQVYLCLLALKMCRLIQTPDHKDSAIDICGYAALLGEGKIKD